MRHIVATRRSDLNVRSGPGLRYPVIASLPKGTVVDVLENRGSWARVGRHRWVSARYLERRESRVIELEEIEIQGRLPGGVPPARRRASREDPSQPEQGPRYKIKMKNGAGVGPLLVVDFVIRDTNREREARYVFRGAGKSILPANLQLSSRRWSNMPDRGVASVRHFNGLGRLTGVSAGNTSISRTDFWLDTYRGPSFDFRNIPTGASLPDAGAFAGIFEQMPPGEFPVGTF